MAGNKGLEALIPVINRLQDTFTTLSIPLCLNLPQIAVVGSQSSGKSSVLENFVGRDFLPRGTGIVTRRPLILQLYHDTVEYGEFLHCKQRFTNFDDIRKEIIAETDRQTGTNKGISNVPINLRIHSPNVLNLTLIDLPGMTKVAIGDQPPDIEIQIRNMIVEFIEKESCLILAVTPANSDLANSDALKLAKEYDPTGLRTIGVLTKLDLMDQGTDASDVLSNRVLPLRRGYVGVINRSQRDIEAKKDIKDALTAERSFFLSHPAYASMSESLGTPYLQRVLNEQLINHIRESLPELRQRIQVAMTSMQAEFDLIKDLPESDDRDDDGKMQETLVVMVRNLEDEYTRIIDGHVAHVDTDALSRGAEISQIFHSRFTYELIKIEFDEKQLRKEIGIAIQNIHGVRRGLFTPDKAFEATVRRFIENMRSPSCQCVDMVVAKLTDVVQDCCDQMNRFPKLREVVMRIVSRRVADLVQSTKSAIMEWFDYQLAYTNTSHEDFIGFNHAKENPNETSRNRIGHQIICRGWLGLSSSFMGSVKYFWFVLTSETLSWYKDEDEREVKYQLALEGLVHRGGSSILKKPSFILANIDAKVNTYRDHKTLEIFADRVEDVENWRANLTKIGVMPDRDDSRYNKYDEPEEPEEPVDPKLEREIEIVRRLVKSYMSILSKSLKDIIPKIIIYHLINKLKSFFKAPLMTEIKREDIADMMQESAETKARREEVKLLYTSFEKALSVINELISNTKAAPLPPPVNDDWALSPTSHTYKNSNGGGGSTSSLGRPVPLRPAPNAPGGGSGKHGSGSFVSSQAQLFVPNSNSPLQRSRTPSPARHWGWFSTTSHSLSSSPSRPQPTTTSLSGGIQPGWTLFDPLLTQSPTHSTPPPIHSCVGGSSNQILLPTPAVVNDSPDRPITNRSFQIGATNQNHPSVPQNPSPMPQLDNEGLDVDDDDQNSWDDDSIDYPSPSVTNLRISRLRRYFSATCCLNTCLLIGLILAIILAIYFATTNYFTSSSETLPLVIDTLCGSLRGIRQSSGVTSFLGVPYALPPTGQRRFKRPLAMKSPSLCRQHGWSASNANNVDDKDQTPSAQSILDATKSRSPCVQFNVKTGQIIGSEDCLYLNVYVPPKTVKDSSKPVVVIISGLFFMFGGSVDNIVDEGDLPITSNSHRLDVETVRRVDAIHVTVNYRFGPLGFLVHPDVGDANAGIYDQLAALGWVRQNIAKFGGDPTRVSLLGLGSGASHALILAYSELSRNLFDRLWLSAPSLGRPTTSLNDAKQLSRKLFNCVDDNPCPGPEQLSLEQLMQSWNWTKIEPLLQRHVFGLPGRSDFQLDGNSNDSNLLHRLIVIDNELVEVDRWHQMTYNLPLVLGQTSHETSVFPTPSTVGLWDKPTYLSFLTEQLLGDNSNTTTTSDQWLNSELYIEPGQLCRPTTQDSNAAHPRVDFNVTAHLSALSTDARLTCPLVHVGRSLVNSIHPVYHYYLSQPHRRFDPYSLTAFASLGFHGWDGMLYLRSYQSHPDYLAATNGESKVDTSELTATSDLLNHAMHEFVHTGQITSWTPMEVANADAVMVNIIDRAEHCPRDDLLSQRCRLWHQITQNDPVKLAWKL